MRHYAKDDISTHSDRYWGPQYPAINVRAYSFGPDLSAIEERYGCSEEIASRAIEWARNQAQRIFWEDAPGIAKGELGADNISSAGRSDGWLIVLDLPPIETWDAVKLSQWRSFEKEILGLKKDLCSAEHVFEVIDSNRWAEEDSEEYNFFDGPDGAGKCLADIPRCAHCK